MTNKGPWDIYENKENNSTMLNTVKLFRVEAGDYLTDESILARLISLPPEEKQRIEREILLASRSLSDSLERSVSPAPHAPLPPPTPEREIASESVLRGSRGIESREDILDANTTGCYKRFVSGRDWLRGVFGNCPRLLAKFDEVDRSEREGG